MSKTPTCLWFEELKRLCPRGKDLISTSLSHYRILERLGQGGMGVVCKAEGTTSVPHVPVE